MLNMKEAGKGKNQDAKNRRVSTKTRMFKQW